MLSLVLDPRFEDRIRKALQAAVGNETVHLSVVDLSTGIPRYAGVNDTELVYPASLYKLYVAMGILSDIKNGRNCLDRRIEISEDNVAERDDEPFRDPRPSLEAGERVTVDFLLNLLITRSDNTAANVLIDLVGRERINQLLRRHGWRGSEVTRKFLPRRLEPEKYRSAHFTRTTTRHLSELLYLLETGWLIGDGYDAHLKVLLWAQHDNTKIKRGLPKSLHFAHKTGWYREAPKVLIGSISGDVGIVEGGGYRYIISCIVHRPGTTGQNLLRVIGRLVHREM